MGTYACYTSADDRVSVCVCISRGVVQFVEVMLFRRVRGHCVRCVCASVNCGNNCATVCISICVHACTNEVLLQADPRHLRLMDRETVSPRQVKRIAEVCCVCCAVGTNVNMHLKPGIVRSLIGGKSLCYGKNQLTIV